MTPAINWNLSLKLANNNPDIAKELLDIYIQELIKSKASIKKNYQQKKYRELQFDIHKLHGASCYCGVAEIKQLTKTIETSLQQNNRSQLSTNMEKLLENIELVLDCYKNKQY